MRDWNQRQEKQNRILERALENGWNENWKKKIPCVGGVTHEEKAGEEK
jgi:hypothetical protein